MCGINGFNWRDSALIRQMNQVTQHRGPDGEGTHLDENISLGFRRLSIIDLSENGMQPLYNEDQNLVIVFNGEIYNYQPLSETLKKQGHRFTSQTDTEAVLHAYEQHGLGCMNLLQGMWGFCIYDKKEGRIILSRDRFGIKPLYYLADGERFIFSSMLSAILCHDIPVRANDRAVMAYLAFNLQQHDTHTFFEGIQMLGAGCALVYDLKTHQFEEKRWYDPKARPTPDQAVLHDTFVSSVVSHLVSDVPVGVTLSGGVDSTAITGVFDRHTEKPFRTYSLVVPGSRVDESVYINEVCRHTKAEPFFTTTEAGEFLNDIDDFVTCMEEPVAAMSVYAEYKVFQLAHQQGAKVLLNGQGGDELFAGYSYYFAYYFYELFTRLRWYSLLREMLLFARKRRSFFPHLMFGFLLLPRRLRLALWKALLNRWLDHDLLQQTCGRMPDPRWQPMDVKTSLAKTLHSTAIPHLLVWADKSSMRWSVECRVPFLDVNFVEHALDLKTEQMLKDGETKRLFRQAVADYLPELIRSRKDKIGFEAPMDDFFREPRLAEFAHNIIHSESFKQRPYWRWQAVEKIFREHQTNRKNNGKLLWKWINLELWFRKFIDPRQTG